ncbi:MAG: hypothetical protein M3Q91_18405 [Acidobacteriota bacterium]|nr:hypothetical protein [Acidobacteriota bacterium]
MELTPEERRKIYEEEKARVEREIKRDEFPIFSTPSEIFQSNKIILLVVGAAVLLLGVYQYYKSNTVEPSAKPNLLTYPATSAVSPPDSIAPWKNHNKPAASPTPFSLSSSLSHDSDMPGQIARIGAEGISEEAVRANILAADKTITYAHLKKNAAKHATKPWSFTGKILEIQEVDGGTVARIGLDAWGSQAIYVAGPITTDFLENNRVFVVGYLAGEYSYTSVANYNMSIPAVAARAMMKPAEAAKYRVPPGQSRKGKT